jgi:hypothetical protein
MFWVIFDTSTKRDYYRDVHNLLALPPGSTIRYDYNERHLSAAAIAEAGKAGASATKVLVAYAQDKNFKKGGADPVGPITYPQGLWIGTRIANLSHLRFSVNRYYFDLELLDYPAGNPGAFDRIMQALAAAQETPFAKWVTASDLDSEFDLLSGGTTSANWASTIDRLGTFPTQFAGDSFWRVAKIARSWPKSNVTPLLNDHTEIIGGQEITTGVDAVYPIYELDKLSVQIESRIPEAGEESRDKEPATARSVTFATAPDGLLKDINGKTLILRRYATDWIEAEVAGTDRVDTQHCDVTLTTGPVVPDAFPIGPELRLRFQVTKRPGTGYFAILFAIAGGACLAGAGFLKDQIEWAILLGVVGVLLFGVAGFLWTGRIRLPGGK